MIRAYLLGSGDRRLLERGRGSAASPSGTAVAGCAAAARGRCLTQFHRLLVDEAGTDLLEQHVELTRNAEPRSYGSHVQLAGTEVQENGCALVQKRLDVDQLTRPILFREDTLAEIEASGFRLVRARGSGQILRRGAAEDPRLIGHGNRTGGLEGCPIVITVLSRGGGFIETDQDLSELDPPIRLNHDNLASRRSRARLRKRAESPDMAHNAVADQIRQFTHRPSPPVDQGAISQLSKQPRKRRIQTIVSVGRSRSIMLVFAPDIISLIILKMGKFEG
jgi:predicted RNA binding protein YcfA (HicA-like mRNA interferase family)